MGERIAVTSITPGGIFDCLSQVSPVSIANLGDGRHSLEVMPEGHGNVPHKKARDRDAIVAMHGECAVTVLISPHHSSTRVKMVFVALTCAMYY
jgi:hypothetical protein